MMSYQFLSPLTVVVCSHDFFGSHTDQREAGTTILSIQAAAASAVSPWQAPFPLSNHI
jgi:hypothetical protein